MKSVVFCGSSRFVKEARLFAKKLEKSGAIVVLPHYYQASGGDWSRIHKFDKKICGDGPHA